MARTSSATRQTRSQSQGRGDVSVSVDRNVVASTSQAQAARGKDKGKKAQQESAPLRSKRGREQVEDTPTTTTNEEPSDAGEDMGEHNRPGPDSRSRSAGGYDWVTECLNLDKEDVPQRMTMHGSFNTKIELNGKVKTVAFHRGDLIYTLPDPQYLKNNANWEVSQKRSELSTEDMWIAQIADCCVFKTTASEQEGHTNLGVLRIRWLYSLKHLKELNNNLGVPHMDYITQMKSMKFDENETIYSDHYDFIGLECFSGFADNVHAYLEIHGLEVPDIELVGPVEKRNPRTLKKWVWITGYKQRKRREAIDMDSRVKRDKDGELTYSNSGTSKTKAKKGAKPGGGQVKASASKAGPSQPAAKKAKR